MKHLFCLSLLFLVFSSIAQVPTRLFDVRNGNGVVDGATTYPAATVIPYKDAASKTKIVDAFCTAYGYQDTINGAPNPQSKQAFFNARLTAYIKGVYQSEAVKAAEKAAGDAARNSTDAEVPPSIR